MAYGFFSNVIVYIKFDRLTNIKQCIGYTYVIFFGVWICVFKKYFLTQYKMALPSVISLDEMKSLEISNILEERHPDIRGLSAMNVRRFYNENRIRTQATLDDLEIEKEVTKSFNEVISKFLQTIRNKMLFYS